MGRNLKFDEDEVIARAQKVFQKSGFYETRLEDLLKAIGLHKGSFYRSFKSKENLFLLALNSYASKNRKNFIGTDDPKEYLILFFTRMVDECTNDSNGCFIMNSCSELGTRENVLAKFSKSYFEEIKSNFLSVSKAAKKAGYLEKKASIEDVAIRLVGAACSIREFSKFQSDRSVFTALANGALKDFNIQIKG